MGVQIVRNNSRGVGPCKKGMESLSGRFQTRKSLPKRKDKSQRGVKVKEGGEKQKGKGPDKEGSDGTRRGS